MISHSIISAPKNETVEAVISAIEKTKNEFSGGAQVVHIIFASLIQTKGKWTCVVSIVSEPDRDGDGNAAIIFGHLPEKYEELYDDILPHVDNLNVIEDDSVWQNIKYYLLDVYFYQAVHFKKLERITETGGGYFKEAEEDIDDELENVMSLEMTQRRTEFKSDESRLFDASFYKAAETSEIKMFRDKEERVRWRQQGNLRHQSSEFIRMLKLEAG